MYKTSFREICIDSLPVKASEFALNRQFPFPVVLMGLSTPSTPSTSLISPGSIARARLSSSNFSSFFRRV